MSDTISTVLDKTLDIRSKTLSGVLDSNFTSKCPVEFLGDFQLYSAGYPLHRENRENGQKIPVRENTGNLEILPKHRVFGLLKL